MLPQKAVVQQVPTKEFRKELEYLRARREAIDSLIKSLETYVRYLPKSGPKSRRAE